MVKVKLKKRELKLLHKVIDYWSTLTVDGTHISVVCGDELIEEPEDMDALSDDVFNKLSEALNE